MLKEISIMRPILIVLLVVYHAFIIYGGGWGKPVGYIEIPIYKHLVWWTYSFMLESFTFISGYIYLYSNRTRGNGSLKMLVKKKTKRLLVPMILFGLVYFIMFFDFRSVGQAVYEILNGAGHLWYLLILFWCFIEAWVLEQIKVNARLKLVGVALLAIFCSELPSPFRIATSFYYLFFFYLPVLFVSKRKEVFEMSKSNPILLQIVSWGLFICLFVLIRYVAHFPRSVESSSFFTKAMILSLNNAMQMLYSASGVIAFYLTAFVMAGDIELINKEARLVKIGGYCFGVYIFQQFVLKVLYFKTAIPAIVGPYQLPWIGIIAAFVFSFICVFIIRLAKVGRALI